MARSEPVCIQSIRVGTSYTLLNFMPLYPLFLSSLDIQVSFHHWMPQLYLPVLWKWWDGPGRRYRS